MILYRDPSVEFVCFGCTFVSAEGIEGRGEEGGKRGNLEKDGSMEASLVARQMADGLQSHSALLFDLTQRKRP